MEGIVFKAEDVMQTNCYGFYYHGICRLVGKQIVINPRNAYILAECGKYY